MSDHAATIRRFWETTEARDWTGLGEVLSPELVYEMAQTRERVQGREAFLRFFAAYPGDWHLTVRRVVADDDGAATMLDFVVGEEQMTGISFFSFDSAGLINRIDDLWPEPYEPPPGREDLTERF
jgi:SnoaL-like domain